MAKLEPLDALKEAVKAWRTSRHPRFAAVAQWATARALPEPRPLVGAGRKAADEAAWLALYEKHDLLDVPRLLATVSACKSSSIAAERLTLLGKLNDPRVVTGVLAILEAPPYSARTAMPFFRAAAKVLAATNDPRVKPALADLAGRYKAIVVTTVGDDLAALFRRTADELDDVKPGPLSAALQKKAAELEALFEKEQGAVSREKSARRTAQQSDDQFLSAIYAAPDDDGPRLVFADTLTERGDVRGEFISLQLTRARAQATTAGLRRERELCNDPRRRAQWGLPLSQGGEAHLARGFPDRLIIDPRSLKTIVGAPALRTVHTVLGFDRSPPLKHTNAFLFGEHARHLKHVGRFTRELFDALAGPLTWEGVELGFSPTAADFARLTRLRRLTLHFPWNQPVERAAFSGLGALEELSWRGPSAPELLPRLPNLRSLELRSQVEPTPLAEALAPLTKLRALNLGWTPQPLSIPLPQLERLEARVSARPRLGAVLEGLPQLKDLVLQLNAVNDQDVLALLSDRAALARVERVSLGSLHFTRPFREDGELTVRQWALGYELERLVQILAALPEGCVRRVVLRPLSDDPTSPTSPPPTEEQLAKLRGARSAGLPLRSLPIDVEWW